MTRKVKEIKPILPDMLREIPIWPYRLRAGADRQDTNEVTIEKSLLDLEESISPMIKKAIQNAHFHGIQLRQGVTNLANGDCAFESVLDGINTRACFGETYEGTPAYWRNVWMSKVEKIAFHEWNNGMSIQEWKDSFEVLKQAGTYEVALGDLVPPGIAHCTQKNLLIFNNSTQAYKPIYVISAAIFGGSANSDIPVCLAYNQVHYESLVPCTQDDIQKTILLSQQVLSNEYNLKMANIPIFENTGMVQHKSDSYDIQFPPLASPLKNMTVSGTKSTLKRKEEQNTDLNEQCYLSLEELQKIPVKKRNREETKRYNQLMYQKGKAEHVETESEKNERQKKD